MSAALDLAKEILADWDRDSEPDFAGLHNGAGFAFDNWRSIRIALRAIVLETEEGEAR